MMKVMTFFCERNYDRPEKRPNFQIYISGVLKMMVVTEIFSD